MSKQTHTIDNMNKNQSTKRQRNTVQPPLRDASAKNLFASIPFLTQILKDTVGELNNLSKQEISELCLNADIHIAKVPVHDPRTPSELLDSKHAQAPPMPMDMSSTAHAVEDTSPIEGPVYFDLLIDLSIPLPDGTRATVIINIEIQNSYDEIGQITKRGIYYCSRLISRQRNQTFKVPHYENLQKVYSIWLLAAAKPPLDNTIRRICLTEQILALQKNASQLPLACYDMMEVIIVGLGENYVPTRTPSVLELLWLVSTLELGKREKLDYLKEVFNMAITKEMETASDNLYYQFKTFYGEKKFQQMWNRQTQKAELATKRALKKAEAKGIEIGKEQGIEIGKEQGIEIGKERGIEIGKEQGIEIGKEQGIEIGKEQGIEIGKEQERETREDFIVSNMLRDHVSLTAIMKYCNLPEARIRDIARKYNLALQSD